MYAVDDSLSRRRFIFVFCLSPGPSKDSHSVSARKRTEQVRDCACACDLGEHGVPVEASDVPEVELYDQLQEKKREIVMFATVCDDPSPRWRGSASARPKLN